MRSTTSTERPPAPPTLVPLGWKAALLLLVVLLDLLLAAAADPALVRRALGLDRMHMPQRSLVSLFRVVHDGQIHRSPSMGTVELSAGQINAQQSGVEAA